MEKLRRTKKNFLWQQRFLYPLPFQDDPYAIAYNRFSNEIDSKKIENSNLNEKFSFLTLKRLIHRIHQKKSLQFLLKNCNINFDADCNSNFYSRAIREGVTMVLEIVFSVQSKPFMREKTEWTSYQSIHSVFPFMEDQFSHSNRIFDMKIPYFLHPELIIRIARRRIQDASFLHPLRFILYKKKNFIIIDTQISFPPKEMTRLSQISWNSYIYEFEYLFVSLWKDFSPFQMLSHPVLLDQINCIKKIRHVIKPSWITLQKFLLCKRILTFRYVRYENNSILSIQSTDYLAEKWKIYFFKIWQYRFHFLFESRRIRIKRLSKNCFPFLGYTFGVRKKITMVQTKMLEDLPITSFVNKQLCSIAPILPLIGSLAREKFCDTLGHPISKLARTTSTDDEIFNRFDKIWKNLYYYYSGCMSRSNLYQVRYILRFSCAKTLACKHKSTIRFVWKKYGLEFFAKTSLLEKRELIFLNLSKMYPLTKKFWYLDIIQINSLVNSLRKEKEKEK
uniref:Maturase K n=1 Tax=Takakia lepidozioides TaxID=37425 RepID=A0A0S3QP24_TAKLE|nr:maturase [Takakia lepidozioides]